MADLTLIKFSGGRWFLEATAVRMPTNDARTTTYYRMLASSGVFHQAFPEIERLSQMPGPAYFRVWKTPLIADYIVVHPQRTLVGGSLVAAGVGGGFLDGLFDRFTAFAGTLLNPAEYFFELAFSELEIVIRKLGPLLFQFALGDVPVAFDF